ncbi:MAG: tRNA (N6-isopentenyl adenosine(37)-C2)-methylthiotransferase MiaB [Nitrospirae bacterium]|nr:tRNA (N6-isopentenyl adenosine(37)-C2)-methylthiotransferase MiaB [Nitrospirota bacterium]
MTERKMAYLQTFGCQMNVHDSEKIAAKLIEQGYNLTDDINFADLILFNTCSIRQKAEQKFYSELGKVKLIKRKKPQLKIAVAGCIAQQEGRAFKKKRPFVDIILGTQNIDQLDTLLNGGIAIDQKDDVNALELTAERQDKVKAFVNIMFGCNNYCSYCVVPYTRGRERSRSSQSILNEIQELGTAGYKEITLLGQNVNSYKSDCSFPKLLSLIHQIEGIERIRFVTSHPKDLDDDLIDTMSQLQKVCNHIHLPLQSGSNAIIKAMNRIYTYEQFKEKTIKLRKTIPEIAITSDIIAGFPGETDSDHNQTITALKEIQFDGIYAFKYSKRPKTKAATMDGHIDEEIKVNRLKEILEVQELTTGNINKKLEGNIFNVMVEGRSETNKNRWCGRTTSNKIVNFDPLPSLIPFAGMFIDIKIIQGFRHSLDGEIVKP